MSDERDTVVQTSGESISPQSPAPPVSAAPAAPETGEKLDAIEDIDFLLEEIENKIAPLALA